MRKYVAAHINNERDIIIEELTSLGAAIAGIQEEVTINTGLDSLGIPSGRYKMIELLNYYIFFIIL